MRQSRANRQLDRISFQLLEELAGSGRKPYVALAEELGISINAVRDRKLNLERRGVIRGYKPVINYPACGRPRSFLAFLSVSTHLVQEASDVIAAMDPLNLSAAFRVLGPHDFVLHLHGADPVDLLAPVENLGVRVEIIPISRDLLRKKHADDLVSPGIGASDSAEALLRLLSKDARSAIRDLALAMDLAETTTRDHLRRLEENGVIDEYATLVDTEAVGFPVRAYLICHVDHPELMDSIGPMPGICHLYPDNRDGQRMIVDVAAPSLSVLGRVATALRDVLGASINAVQMIVEPVASHLENVTMADLAPSGFAHYADDTEDDAWQTPLTHGMALTRASTTASGMEKSLSSMPDTPIDKK